MFLGADEIPQASILPSLSESNPDRRGTFAPSQLRMSNGLGISVQDSVLVGDSYVDAEGARRVGMDFAAVIYGVGFKSKEEVEGYNCVAYLYSAEDIYSRLSVL